MPLQSPFGGFFLTPATIVRAPDFPTDRRLSRSAVGLTDRPACPSDRPTVRPTVRPPVRPTVRPSDRPSDRPSVRPTVRPSVHPTDPSPLHISGNGVYATLLLKGFWGINEIQLKKSFYLI